ncbi:hypothetical protein DKX38_012818 [Salix brachista]|uniref:WIT1/2 N-terminal helical bundle domain-containing protein n=1 Tax=Salix brachista TaxID=2182728 RepID=A0A5N5LRX8_9ROSI|nr:hypothetical protein DKX38_012818 [Salix brachista]
MENCAIDKSMAESGEVPMRTEAHPVENTLDATMGTENSYILAIATGKALKLYLLSGILDSEVREVESFMENIQSELGKMIRPQSYQPMSRLQMRMQTQKGRQLKNKEMSRGYLYLYDLPEYGMKIKAILAFFFSTTTPFGIVVGNGLSNVYSESNPTALMVVGILNASSAGLLN